MREESLFIWQHPLIGFNGTSLCLFIIRSWNAHLGHFLSDKVISSYSSLFCFTEININDSPSKDIFEILNVWKRIHKNTQLGMAVCFEVGKVNIKLIDIPSVLEMMLVVLEIEKESILLLVVYCMPGPLATFIDDLISMINEVPIQQRTLTVCDFSLDQMLPANVA